MQVYCASMIYLDFAPLIMSSYCLKCLSSKSLHWKLYSINFHQIWKIPDEGLKRDLTDAVVELHGHQRKVGSIQWHPLANNILASAGFDNKVIIWNVEKAEPAIVIEGHKDTIYSMSWSRDGNLLATTCKDKMLRIIDPRKGEIIAVSWCIMIVRAGPGLVGGGAEGRSAPPRGLFVGKSCSLVRNFVV